MSTVLTSRRRPLTKSDESSEALSSASTFAFSYTSSSATRYKPFVFDIGTNGTYPQIHRMHALAVREFYSEYQEEGEEVSSPADPPALFTALIGTDPRSPALTFPRVWRELTSFITSNTPSEYTPLLIAHNAPFDTAFIESELERASMVVPSSWRFACSLQMAKKTFGEGQSCSQAVLAERFGVEPQNEHHAEDDTRVLCEILNGLGKQKARHSKSGDSMLSVLSKMACGLHDMAVRYDNYATVPNEDFKTRYEPTGNEDNDNSSETVYVTRTGRLWHRNKDCFALRNATKIIPVDKPDPNLKPCLKCANDQPGNTDVFESSDRNNRSRSPPSESDDVNITSHVFVTRTGKLYHGKENCSSLRLAHQVFRVSSPRPGLRPCWKCTDTRETEAVSQSNVSYRDSADSARVQRRNNSSIDGLFQGADNDDTDDEYFNTGSDRNRDYDDRNQRTVVYVTRTGRLWHRNKNCFALRRATRIIPVFEPDQELSPCWRCSDEHTNNEPVLRSDRNNEARSSPSQPTDVYNAPAVFVTRTGKLYHADEECSSLRLAHQVFRVSSPRPELLPCWKCVGDAESKAVPLTNVDYDTKREEVTKAGSSASTTDEEFVQSNQPSPRVVRLPLPHEHRAASEIFSIAEYGPFVRTATGMKFHRKDCATVRERNTFHHDHNSRELEPCRRCLADVYLMWHQL